MNTKQINPLDHRSPQTPIDALFLRRWSARAMNGEPLGQEQLMRLFEAARWAPSSMNRQEWFFLYAHRSTPEFEVFLGLLSESNRAWCGHAGVLAMVLSQLETEDGKPNPRTHQLSAGMALENLLLQATLDGLVCHPMAGFDLERTREELKVPERFEIHCMLALGLPGEVEDLPERQQAREVPSQRKTVEEFTREGGF